MAFCFSVHLKMIRDTFIFYLVNIHKGSWKKEFTAFNTFLEKKVFIELGCLTFNDEDLSLKVVKTLVFSFDHT